MRKVYQRFVDAEHGDCMQAAVASLFDDEYENVPTFIEHKNWFELFVKYVESKGYEYKGMLHNHKWGVLQHPTDECFQELKFAEWKILSNDNMKPLQGVNGLFFCSVLSPNYFSWNNSHATHAVICDSNFNIIHDPSKDYQDIKAYPLSSVIDCNGIISVCNISKTKVRYGNKSY